MNVLVTGGAGYIGSHTAKALALAGHTPVVFDNLTRGRAQSVRWGPLIIGDLANEALLLESLIEHRIEAVLHFAAYAYVGESNLHPGNYFHNNLVNSLRLIEATRLARIQYFVFSSTCATYGDPSYLPIDEAHPQVPVNPYGESKLAVERLLRWYGEIHGLSWTALRYFNAAGADPDGELGEDHDPETHLIPLVLNAITNPDRPVSILGTDYQTFDGTAIRDYIHVTDLANAHLQALTYLVRGGRAHAFNLGSGRGHSVLEVLEAATSISGCRPAVQLRDRRHGDPAELVANSSLANDILHWTANYSSLNKILETAWNWQIKRKLKQTDACSQASIELTKLGAEAKRYRGAATQIPISRCQSNLS